ncbi:uncharacterized protein N7443_001555 [Penicillium atrosanguineum]|uniref:uncharacterized protein n=1 Tax=Penicillium atrosanguineum TaxID=1132637 RepID=UPI00238408CA|nr:uncharacterized protein N7443_001555 [Penicillium atrosanguineum]KAJ5314671.1 hypothetical protein N7443_001555 [Penicillium atrosanguineum]
MDLMSSSRFKIPFRREKPKVPSPAPNTVIPPSQRLAHHLPHFAALEPQLVHDKFVCEQSSAASTANTTVRPTTELFTCWS